MNPGGVRAELLFNPRSPAGEQPGQVIYGEVFAVQPFGNFLVSMDLTGAQVQAVLEKEVLPPSPRAQLVLGISDGLTFDCDPERAAGLEGLQRPAGRRTDR